jgi:hypothetical protein
MTATNHALTGAIIGLAVHNPWIAIPAAVLSHLICDAIPHFGSDDPNWITTRKFKIYLVVEAFICFLIVLTLALSGAANWLLAAVCAFAAASPDFLSISTFRRANKNEDPRRNALQTFLKKIQWFEHPVGAVVEVVWACSALLIISSVV